MGGVSPEEGEGGQGAQDPQGHLLGGEGSVILVTVNSPPPMQVILCAHGLHSLFPNSFNLKS